MTTVRRNKNYKGIPSQCRSQEAPEFESRGSGFVAYSLVVITIIIGIMTITIIVLNDDEEDEDDDVDMDETETRGDLQSLRSPDVSITLI